MTQEAPNADGDAAYQSADIGSGWHYWLTTHAPEESERYPGKLVFKAGFTFSFENDNRAADPSPVCSLDYETFLAAMKANHFVEQVTYGEFGGVDALNYIKNDIDIQIGPRDVGYLADGTQCILRLQTADGV